MIVVVVTHYECTYCFRWLTELNNFMYIYPQYKVIPSNAVSHCFEKKCVCRLLYVEASSWHQVYSLSAFCIEAGSHRQLN